jgi:hypothetical protein
VKTRSLSQTAEMRVLLTKVNFLSFILEEGKMRMDPVKLAGIADWPAPTILRQL